MTMDFGYGVSIFDTDWIVLGFCYCAASVKQVSPRILLNGDPCCQHRWHERPCLTTWIERWAEVMQKDHWFWSLVW